MSARRRCYRRGVRSHQLVPALLAAATLACACSGDLVPTPARTQATRDAARATALDAQLRALPGVVDVRAMVRTPVDDPLAPQRQEPPASASVAVHAEASRAAALAGEVRALAAAALPDVDAARLTVVIAEATPTTAMAKVGPFEVAPRSRGPLRATLAIVFGLIIALAGFIAWRERRAT